MELELPHDSPELTRQAEPDVAVSVAPEPVAAESSAPAAPTPAAPAPPPTGEFPTVAREERAKRKAAQSEVRELKRDLARYRDLELARDRIVSTRPATTTPLPVLDDARLSEVVRQAEQQAEGADTMGKAAAIAADVTLKETRRLLRELHEAHQRQREADRFNDWVERSESAARTTHADFDQVLAKARIWEAVQVTNGKFADPVIAQAIYFSGRDPATEAYRIARARLAAEEIERSGADEDEYLELQVGGPPTDGTRPNGPASEPAVTAEAERRGAQRVVREMAEHAALPKGTRGLPPAGKPTAVITRAYLDELSRTNPGRYEALVATAKRQGKDLVAWHWGATDTL